MNKKTRFLGWLLEGICALFIALCAGMLFLWTQIATEIAAQAPEFAYLRIPALICAEITTACVIVFIVCLWVLIHKALVKKIFVYPTLTWVYIMIMMCAIAGICALVCVIMVPPSPATYALSAALLFCVAVAIVLLILRNLLCEAIEQHDELAGVI